jgi:DNA-binding NtrC family response regulator
MSRVLVVDDEAAIGWSLRELLGDLGHEVGLAASAEEAERLCDSLRPDCILLDVRLPGRDGLAAIPELRRISGGAPIIVMTAFGDLDTAVRAVEAGAFEYLVKPFDLTRVSELVGRAIEEPPPVTRPGGEHSRSPLLGSSPVMQEVFKQIALVSASDVPVLLTGETGSGKDLAARLIHANSDRRERPFIATNLAALAPGILESELFGHVRGAFTGATADRAGLFEQAAGGTIFLDEIAEAPAEVQVKLLRVLENREVAKVGSTLAEPIDVRVVAATNRDPAEAVRRAEFREDLFHRLSVFPIRMPSLAERRDDIPLLARHFADAASGTAASLSDAFIAALKQRPWPGNVRQLKHAVEYAVVLSRGSQLRPDHLPPIDEPAFDPLSADAVEALEAAVRRWSAAARSVEGLDDLHERLLAVVEPALLCEVLAHTGGNRTAAAKLLGLDRATLRTRLRRFGIDETG